MGTEKINRLKIVLVEQASLEMLMKIASILNVDARRLINNGIEK